MRMRWIGLAATLAVAAACGGSRVEEAAGPGCNVDAKPANMSFTLKNTKGDPLRLADYKGKVLFLNFWATWCVPCKVEIPVLIELQDRYRDQGLEVVGVVVMDDFANAAPYAA